ncbi:MAG: hypothetical protein HKN50_12205 [Gammaproteobacteria bacterium]|nr:hypothetical protein [Gammaproteobacteria bacterium]
MRTKFCCVTLFLLSCMGSGAASADTVTHQAKPLFQSHDPVQAVLSVPLTQIYKQRKQKVRLYQEGTFAYLDGNTKVDNIAVKARTRGNYRRLNCKNPPLRLNFKKKQNSDNLLAGQDKLKLVGPCENSRSNSNLIGLEYLAYQIFERVSDYHFKTRLLKLSYVDTDKKRKPRTVTTFVIEDAADVAKRSGLKRHKGGGVTRAQLDLKHAAMVELFQLLISNYDYSLFRGLTAEECCHNTRLFKAADGSGKLITIPYDFDMSGFVDAPYSTVPERYRIRSSRERKYSGFCKEEQHTRDAISLFNKERAGITALIENASVIDERTRKSTLRYVDRFFEMINDETTVQKKILGACRGNIIKG